MVAGFFAEAVLVDEAEALDASSGARRTNSGQQDDAEERAEAQHSYSREAPCDDMRRTFCARWGGSTGAGL